MEPEIGPGSLLTPIDELCRMFQQAVPEGQRLLTGEQPPDAAGDGPPELASARLTSVFEGCVARLESAGLVKRLKLGDYVLLQPELLDAYAGAIVNAAREEPDGLGSILEAKVVEPRLRGPVRRPGSRGAAGAAARARYPGGAPAARAGASRADRRTACSWSSPRPTGATCRRPRRRRATASSSGSKGRSRTCTRP